MRHYDEDTLGTIRIGVVNSFFIAMSVAVRDQ